MGCQALWHAVVVSFGLEYSTPNMKFAAGFSKWIKCTGRCSLVTVDGKSAMAGIDTMPPMAFCAKCAAHGSLCRSMMDNNECTTSAILIKMITFMKLIRVYLMYLGSIDTKTKLIPLKCME